VNVPPLQFDGVALLIGPDASGATDVRTSLEILRQFLRLELGDALSGLSPQLG
jgi:hypothetical protein